LKNCAQNYYQYIKGNRLNCNGHKIEAKQPLDTSNKVVLEVSSGKAEVSSGKAKYVQQINQYVHKYFISWFIIKSACLWPASIHKSHVLDFLNKKFKTSCNFKM
jgi:hypothetical protein